MIFTATAPTVSPRNIHIPLPLPEMLVCPGQKLIALNAMVQSLAIQWNSKKL